MSRIPIEQPLRTMSSRDASRPRRSKLRRPSLRKLQLESLEARQLLAVMISEIMYHPSSEDSREEFIEIHNSGPQSVNLEGWQFTDGIDYTFPNMEFPAGGYLVIAADTSALIDKYPNLTDVVGNWSGRLSNSSETIELQDASGLVVDQVTYADEGDWATRTRITDEYGETGWEWVALHDGGDVNGNNGKSLELIQPNLPNENGQNWAASVPDNGTPGLPNSRAATSIAPLISEVQHAPAIPHSTQDVTVSARVVATTAALPSVELRYRRDGQPTFQTVAMQDAGVAGDLVAGDGIYTATIPPQAHGTIVEFYVRALHDVAQVRTWPAPTTSGQNANALYQVDDSFDWSAHQPGTLMAFYQVMTSAERTEFENITRESNAQKNASVVIVNGANIDIRYSAGVRIRGSQSRDLNPPPNRINLPSDAPWNGVDQLTLNSNRSSSGRNSVTSHIAGSALFRLAGLAAADSVGVRMYSNGVDLLGRAYALMETPNSDFVDHHFAEDSEGNFYRGRRPNESPPGSLGAGLQYFGTDPVAYGGYDKLTNEGERDWTDVIELTYALNNCGTEGQFQQCVGNDFPENYVEIVSEVVNIDQWLRTLAMIALVDNNENGLLIGDQAGDDYMMYRGVSDPRFEFVVHDLDALFSNPTRSINRFQGVDALDRLVNHPEIRPRYHAQLLDLIDNVILTDMANATLDEALRGVTSQAEIQNIKSFLQARADFVRGQISDSLTVDPGLPMVGQYYHSQTSSLVLTGTTPGSTTRSLTINGYPATELPGNGAWSFVSTRSGGGAEQDPLTLVELGSTWKYLDDGSDQGTAWRHPDYDDAAWDSGPAELGYGDGDEETVVGFIDANPNANGTQRNATTYFRHAFNVADASQIASLQVRMRYDDAAAIYLNGVEVLRTANLAPNAAFDTYTGSDTPSESQYFEFLLPGAAVQSLVDGTNTLAVEIHQDSANSSDISFDMELTAEIISAQGPSGFALHPGINRIVVEAFDGAHGTGNRIASEALDVWYDGPAASTHVDYRPVEVASIDLQARDSYLPGVPLVVRIDARDAQGHVARELWNATATLSVDNPAIKLSVDEVPLVNGMGSALVWIEGIGDFDLSAHLGTLSETVTIAEASMSSAVAAGGVLPQGTTQWSGIVHVTSNLTVPVGATLEVLPGTLVLVDGDPAGAQNSTVVTVQGALKSLGTAHHPVTWTAAGSEDIWGQIDFQGGQGEFRFTTIDRAGNAVRQGRSSSGAALRLRNGAQLSFELGTISDLRGMAIYALGGQLEVRDSLFTRMAAGPELDDTAVQFHDNWMLDIAGKYHPAGLVDDNDAMAIHSQQPGQVIELSGGVVAGSQDDGLDLLGPTVDVSDFMLRDVGDMAISLLGGTTTVEDVVIVDADTGISAKANDGQTANVTVDHATIANVNQGIAAENENGQAPSASIQIVVTNSIVRVNDQGDAISTDYDPQDVSITYSNIQEPWPGVGNLNTDPRFAHPAKHNFRLLPGSPSIDAGQTGALDADGTRTDQGFYQDGLDGNFAPAVLAGGSITDDTILSPWNGPYRVTSDLEVAPGAKLIIVPGTTIYFEPNVELVVRGELIAEGNDYSRIRWTSDPTAPDVPDLPGLPDGPPRWDGVHFDDSRSNRNLVSHVDVEYAQDDEGSIGLLDSNAVIDGITIRGTHLNMIYGDDASLELRNSIFPDMFAPGEMPSALGLDDVAEHVKLVGDIPAGGRLLIQNNVFGTNRGHNDIIDAQGGTAPGPILQVLDNVFLGVGDEQIDLSGDAYIAGNLFTRVFKSDETPDSGYASAISAGDSGETSNIVVVRNYFIDVDHALNLKGGASAIFENNTVYRIHPDFEDRFGNLNIGSAINFFVDEPNATPGRGAYVEGNIFYDLPRVFGNADQPDGTVTALAFHNNLVDDTAASQPVGTRPGTVMQLGAGNAVGNPRFVDVMAERLSLDAGSLAAGAGRLGQDMGANLRGGIWISGEPPQETTSTTAQLTVGGPGIVAYQYRIDGGPWSSEIGIGNGIEFDDEIIRTDNIVLSGLSIGSHTVEVRGKDFAGNWQLEPTVSRTWTVVSNGGRVRISEVLASNDGAFVYQGITPDAIELFNDGSAAVDLGGMSLTDDPAEPAKYVFPAGTQLAAGAYLVLIADDVATGVSGHVLDFGLSNDGETIYLFDTAANGRALIDSVSFGLQIPDRSIGRVGHDGHWALNTPTLGEANIEHRTGNPEGLVINEWLASGDIRHDNDYVELYNPDDLPVSLDGLYLSDNPNALPHMFRIPSLSFIDARGFGTFIADGDTQDGPDHLNFRLSAVHETVALVTSRFDVLDRVMYYAQYTDISQGRLPDGAGQYGYASLPTPGTANQDPSAPALHQALLDELRISEVMYNPDESNGSEFIELVNIGSQPLQLDGVRIAGGVDVTLSATTLDPGERVVVVQSPQEFIAVYGTVARIVGTFSGSLSNGGEELVLQLPSPFDVAVLRFTYDDSWQPNTDGDGPALEFVDVHLPYTAWVDSANWTTGVLNGGTPGGTTSSWPPVPGDLNGDGAADLDDLNRLLGAIQPPAPDHSYDQNGDLVANMEDVRLMVEEYLGTFLGDANLDRRVDANDFNVWMEHAWQTGDKSWSTADFNGDGSVDGSDLNILNANKFRVAAAAPAATARVPRFAAGFVPNLNRIGDNNVSFLSGIDVARRQASNAAWTQQVNMLLTPREIRAPLHAASNTHRRVGRMEGGSAPSDMLDRAFIDPSHWLPIRRKLQDAPATTQVDPRNERFSVVDVVFGQDRWE